jgi:CubicO group peptidase (beta-lactamase class C family)
MAGAAVIDGRCDRSFEPLRRAFEENFAARNELGAAVSVTVHGETVVDLWGGYADAAGRKPWRRDTIVCMMSVAKAVSALCVHMLADRDAIDVDAPIAKYWPEFAQQGKEEIPVAWALSHLASVPVADAAPRGALYDWKIMTEAIAAQAPLWPPGTTPCYHTATQGFILGELVRRVDGRSIGTFIREEIAGPLGIDYHIGLTPAEEARCADMVPSKGNVLSTAQSGDTKSLLARGWAQLPLREDFNSPRWRRAEVPSANGHGAARAIGRLYACLAQGGEIDGVRLIGSKALKRARTEQWSARDAMSGLNFRIALGFYLNAPPDRPMGPNRDTFGHSGAGGAQSFGDPALGLGFCYAPNRMHAGIDIGPRATALIDALYACV